METRSHCATFSETHLDAFQRGDPHVEEDSVQHWHRNELQRIEMIKNIARRGKKFSFASHLEGRCHENRTAHEDKDHESGDALLPDPEKLGLLSGSGAARFHLEAVHVRNGEDGGRHEPGQAHYGAHAKHE